VRTAAAVAALLWAASCRPAGPALEGQLDRLIPPLLEEDSIPAAVVVAGSRDGVDYRRAFGRASLDTQFDLASCTKVVATTTCIMKLVEEGRLSLDAPAGTILDCFAGRSFTVRDLLHHRSGLPAYFAPASRGADAILAEAARLKPVKEGVYS
jgi:CubicO group peptidase (beta-lactamase class C family)